MMLSPIEVGGSVLGSWWRSNIVRMESGSIGVVICDIREITVLLGGVEKLIRRFGGGAQFLTIVNADFVTEDPCYVSGW